jgi:two-component system nitrate/nitrite response regulator NarL
MANTGQRACEPSRRLDLPAREQLYQLSANGSSGREIAAELVLSPATVKSHFENIYTKLSVSDRVSALAIGLRQGFLD